MKTVTALALLALAACATKTPTPTVASTPTAPARDVAALDVSEKDLAPKTVNKLIQGIFHSYLQGQVLLYKFDESLDQNAAGALESDTYHELLAIRSLVDHFEHDMNELYLKLVMVSALPKYDQAQKDKARASLQALGDFFGGITTNHEELPENLKPLILSNLREKQTVLFDELQAIHDQQKDAEAQKVIHENMVLLRATRMKYFKDLKQYQVDRKLVDQEIQRLAGDQSFKQYKREVKRLSKEMKKQLHKVERSRSTSADTIFPSAGVNGNISGRGYPANTWSLTYDDGPGGKTSPTILKNLQDRKLKATFFMLAKQVEALPTLSGQIRDAGMDLASHSYDHAQLTKVSGAALTKQIEGAKAILEAKLGKPIKLFRLPYGAGTNVASIRTKIAAANMIHIFWTVDTLDWQDKNPQSILDRTLKQMKAFPKNNGIVLFHDIHPQSVIASTMLMDHWIKNKDTVCTVQEVIDQLNQGLASCQPQPQP